MNALLGKSTVAKVAVTVSFLSDFFSIGRKVFLRHIRSGKELAPIALDDNYDFNYQEARVLDPPRTVLPVCSRRQSSSLMKK